MAAFRKYESGSYYRPSMFGGNMFFPPVVKWLIISNTLIWVLLDVFLVNFKLHNAPIFATFEQYLALWPLGENFMPWQLLTYLFLHGGFWHLFFNMFALWMFGMELEHVWGSRKFLIFYLLCGIAAGVSNNLIAPLFGPVGPTIGASGSVYGVLVAFGMLFPDRPIYLYFLLPIRAKYFVAGFIGIQVYYGITGTDQGVAHIAHLGGALVGFVYMLLDLDLIPARRWWQRSRLNRNHFSESDGRFSPDESEVHEARFYDIETGRRREQDREPTQDVIDAILDKISKGGYQSLTEEEKRILNEASRKIH